MNVLTKWLFELIDLFHAAKDKKLQWLQNNQQRQIELTHQQRMADKSLDAELKKKSAELEHQMTLLKTKQAAELSMLKTKCKQDIEDYRQYLEALDKLKLSIRNSYAHLPESVAFTIHHHAKYLLHRMWEAEDLETKIRLEIQLIQLMTTVHEDAGLYLENSAPPALPEKTLNLIQNSKV
ncbi:MAG: hypothetical protein ACU84H_09375 [Gammaproteobacteria bacterium]